jgi:hypothetical protein
VAERKINGQAFGAEFVDASGCCGKNYSHKGQKKQHPQNANLSDEQWKQI